MIVTVTPNAAIDRTIVVHGLTVGTTNRAVLSRTDPGGKGINVARHLARLGGDVVATGFLGVADAAAVMDALAAQGIRTDFLLVPGETRVNLKILDRGTSAETEINESGASLGADAVAALIDKVRALAPACDVMVFSGSLPPGAPDDFYARAIAVAAAAGARTVLDTAGEALRHGIAARPDLVKPNRAEAEELLGMPLRDADIGAAASALIARGARRAVISLGAAGALSASSAGTWLGRAPDVVARNTVGAGDAMVAALVCALVHSLSEPEALRLAIAVASAAAASEGPLPPPGSHDALLPNIRVEAVVSPGAPYGAAGLGS